MSDPYPNTIAAIGKALATGECSSVEITEHYLQRASAFDGALNSFITLCAQEAIEAAKRADEIIAKRQHHALTGVPYAAKDIFCTEGIKTSCASKMLSDFVAPYDASVIKKLRDTNAVLLGKTNMDEFAMGSTNETSYYGAARNPWDTDLVPGGSSGGSAVAVAANLAPGALGTDTGGSIRQPAAFCGVSGLKPTYGRVSRYGMIAFASSLDQGGPMARTAEDLALLLNEIAGFDKRDSTSARREPEDFAHSLEESISGKTIGLPDAFFDDSLDASIRTIVEHAIEVFKQAGARVCSVEMPNLKLSIPAYYVIAPAEASSNLSRYDGVRFGYRCDNPADLEDLYCRSRAEGFGEEVKRRILVGTYALSSGYYDAYYLKAQKVRRLIQQDFKHAFESVDLIAGPTAPSPAFPLGQDWEDPVALYLADIYTCALNLAGLPGASIPAGFCAGLPVGLQLIGNYFEEAAILNFAHIFQKDTDWHLATPPGFG
ncbi:MAG: Asp-tRNA(Asn)/Glu-tRNA(Gln) amidotransferase subunit GatA [Pseudomonadota bacterium]